MVQVMTALDKYIRLEAVGQWKETADGDPREVVVSFGDATLVLSDFQENPLCHWALAATRRVSIDGTRAIYTPDTAGFETLEINDSDMTEAIAQVSRITLNQTPPKKRKWGLLVAIIMLLAGVAAVAPLLLRMQAQSMTGPANERHLGYQMFETTGLAQCGNPEGNAARDTLVSKLFSDDSFRLLVVADLEKAKRFPGGLIVLGRQELQSYLSLDDFSNWLIEISKAEDRTINTLLRSGPLKMVFSYVTSGELPEETLAELADSIILNYIPAPVNSTTETVITPVLRPQEWQALRQICLD